MLQVVLLNNRFRMILSFFLVPSKIACYLLESYVSIIVTRKSITYNYMLYKALLSAKLIITIPLFIWVDELDSVRLSLIRCTFQYP